MASSKRGSEKVMAAWKARILTEASVKEIGAALDKSPAKIAMIEDGAGELVTAGLRG
jgi:hypothetical protein